MKLLKNSKQVGGMQSFILGIVSVAVVLAVGLIVLGELQTAGDVTNLCATAEFSVTNATAGLCQNATNSTFTTAYVHSSAYTSTGTIVQKLATVPTWIGIIIVVALAFIVLGYFYSNRG